jgi:hypothetical protein
MPPPLFSPPQPISGGFAADFSAGDYLRMSKAVNLS